VSDPCALGFDADHVARALEGDARALDVDDAAAFRAHLPGCAACRRTAAALVSARGVWKRALDHDDAFALHGREQRLTSAEGVPRVRGGRLGLLLLGAATGALVVSGWLALGRPPSMPLARAPVSPGDAVTMTAPSPRAPSPLTLPSASAATLAPPRPLDGPAPAAERAPPIETLVAARACHACARGGVSGGAPRDVGAGAVIGGDEEVAVARGSTLVLSWSLQGGLVDPMSSVDVEGPATVHAVAAERAGGSPAILVARGVAHAQTNEPRELRTDLARTRADHAAWRVDARADRTRVEGVLGEVRVDALGVARGSITVHAGEVVDVLRDGRTVPVSRVAPPRAAPRASVASDLWEASEAALRAGDRAAAEAALRALLSGRGPSPVHERASLRLAELELARGDRASARARLLASMHAEEHSVAADAALLLARAQPSARDRADVWRAYLATSPPSPYREQASVERASALVDLGDREGAEAIASALHAAASLPDVARAGLSRLDDRLRVMAR
jgi:hypothetical protein